MRAGVGLEHGKVDGLADAATDLVAAAFKVVHQRLLLKARGEVVFGDVNVRVQTDLVRLVHKIQPVFLRLGELPVRTGAYDAAPLAGGQTVHRRSYAHMDKIALADDVVERLADKRAVVLAARDHDIKAVLLHAQLTGDGVAPLRDLRLEHPGLHHGEHCLDHHVGDLCRLPGERHFNVGFFVFDLEVELLRVAQISLADVALEPLKNAQRHDRARREQRQCFRLAAADVLDHVLDAVSLHGVFFIRQLQHLHTPDTAAGARRELLGDVAALQTRQNGKAVFADDARHRLNGDVGVAAEIRHVAVIVLVRIDDAAVIARRGERLINSLLAASKFLRADAQCLVDLRRAGEDVSDDVRLLVPFVNVEHSTLLFRKMAC